jgi:hypothetical protein
MLVPCHIRRNAKTPGRSKMNAPPPDPFGLQYSGGFGMGNALVFISAFTIS